MGHTSASVIPLIRVGRGIYSVVHTESGVTCFLVCQISSVEGSKYIKIRSPFQVPHSYKWSCIFIQASCYRQIQKAVNATLYTFLSGT